jgi:hypothetical protein
MVFDIREMLGEFSDITLEFSVIKVNCSKRSISIYVLRGDVLGVLYTKGPFYQCAVIQIAVFDLGAEPLDEVQLLCHGCI